MSDYERFISNFKILIYLIIKNREKKQLIGFILIKCIDLFSLKHVGFKFQEKIKFKQVMREILIIKTFTDCLISVHIVCFS